MAAPVARDEELELEIDSLAYGGNGVARLNGFVVFVRRGLPGDTVRARVTKVKRGFAEAIAAEVLEPSPQRIDAPCKHYPRAAAAAASRISRYEAQIAAKEAQVGDALGGSAGSPTRRSSRSFRPWSSSTTATSSSTRSRRRRAGPRSGSTAPAAGTRCSRSTAAG